MSLLFSAVHLTAIEQYCLAKKKAAALVKPRLFSFEYQRKYGKDYPHKAKGGKHYRYDKQSEFFCFFRPLCEKSACDCRKKRSAKKQKRSYIHIFHKSILRKFCPFVHKGVLFVLKLFHFGAKRRHLFVIGTDFR